LAAVNKDRAVQSIGVTSDKPNAPVAQVYRQDFDRLTARMVAYSHPVRWVIAAEDHLALTSNTREQTHRAHLTVIKAVFSRGKRKWQFYWEGHKISATIAHQGFFDELEARSVALRQGDALDADLLVEQRRVEGNVWENVKYTVTKVYKVTQGETQQTLSFSPHVADIKLNGPPSLPGPHPRRPKS
jgi:hypothetical protein